MIGVNPKPSKRQLASPIAFSYSLVAPAVTNHRLFAFALACAFVVSSMARVDSAQTPAADTHAKRMVMASQLGHAGMAMAMSTGSSSQYSESDIRKAEAYPLNMTHLADNVAKTNLLSVLATNEQRLTLKLVESDNFIGNHTYITAGPNGTKIPHRFLGRSFQGSLVSDPKSRATLLIAPEGLYGSVQSQGRIWSFQPKKGQEFPSHDTVIQEVSTYAVPPTSTGNSTSQGPLSVPLPLPALPPLPSNMSSAPNAPKPTVPNLLSPQPEAGSGSGGGSGSAPEDTNQGTVTVYEHCDFQGWKASFGVGIFNLVDLQARGGQNDQASAIRVSGSSLTVTLYEHDRQGGRTLTLGPGDTSCLAPYEFNDIMSSLVVEGSPSGNSGGGQGSGLVTLYEHCNYQGWTASFGVGTFNLADIQSHGGRNDEASAVVVSSGATVTLYKHNYEGGDQLQLGPGSYTCLVDYSFNDLTSSLVAGSGDVGGGNGGNQLWIKSYADYDYPGYAPDWYNRIVSAYNQGWAMWSQETNIHPLYYPPEQAPHNFAQSGNDGGLAVFNGWVHTLGLTGPNSYGLFQAANEPGWNPAGLGGQAYTHKDSSYCDTLSYQSRPIDNNSCPSHMIVAKDWYSSDTWAPDDTWTLGLGANHELTHNAGEWCHPSDADGNNVCDGGNYGACSENIMENPTPYWCKNYYRMDVSKSRVFSYAPQFMH